MKNLRTGILLAAAAVLCQLLAGCAGGGTSSAGSPVPLPGNNAAFAPATGGLPANIYVAEFDRNEVDVFAGNANGDAAPVRAITNGGSLSSDEVPFGLALDKSNNLYVSYFQCGCFSVYSPTANGNAAPLRKVTSSTTNLVEANALVNDSAGDTFVASLPNGGGIGLLSTVSVFAPGANGSVPPIGTITIPFEGDLLGLAFDSQGRLYVASSPGDIYIYAPGTCGPASPIATIQGTNTHLVSPKEIAFDFSGALYVANPGEAGLNNASITVYAPGATGNAAPIRTIAGPNTMISDPWGVAVDGVGNVYVADLLGNRIMVFAPGANGDVAPIRTISGPDTQLHHPVTIMVR